MTTREFKSGDPVSIKLADGTIEAGWRIFTVDPETNTAFITKEIGSELESKKVALAELE